MKKIVLLFVILINICFISSCSCKKKGEIDYKYVGLYVELINLESRDINDRNLKLYYDESQKILNDTNQIYEYQIQTSSINKNIYEINEMTVYDFAALYTISVGVDVELDKAKVYPIVYDGGKYQILDESKTIDIVGGQTKTVSFELTYSYEKEDYAFKATIKILKKEK